MNKIISSALVAVLGFALAGAAARAAEETTTKTTRTEHTSTKSANQNSDQMNPDADTGSTSDMHSSAISGRDAKSVISAWPSPNKTAAQALIEKYGQPDGVMDRELVWNDRTPFHKVAIFRDSQQVDFPTSHQAYIENAVNYKVPSSKVADLIQFDPGLVPDLVRGTLASHGDSEKQNILALNLADEIVTGKRSVSSAKSFMRSTQSTEASGRTSGYSDRLLFTPSGETNPNTNVNPADQSMPAMPGPDQVTPSTDETTPSQAQPNLP